MKRTTSETDVGVSVNLDGLGKADVETGNKFINHLIASFSHHSMMDVHVRASSLDGILHHLVEDTAITLGKAICDALGSRHGVARFGHTSIPMDEALVEVSVDLIRRPYGMVNLSLKGDSVENVPHEDITHFFASLIQNMEACVHVRVIYGDNDHHKSEAAIKALAVSMRQAISPDSKYSGAPSTKGTM